MYEAIEAEQSVISCLMQRPECIESVYNNISCEMFESGILGRAYLEYRKAYDSRKELTIIELHQNLAADYPSYEIEQALKDCAMMQALPYQINGFATAVVNHYKKTCIDAILQRTEIKDATVDEQLDKMIAELESLHGGSKSEGHTVMKITELYKNDYFCGEKKPLVYLDVEEIDSMTGGFQGGDVVLLGARPSVGKSALAMQWAEAFAKQGKKVGYYNLEMQERSLFERLVASKSGLEITRIRRATKFNNDEEERYGYAIDELEKQENIVLFTGAKSVADIRKDQREYKFDIIIIDYLQLLSVDNRYQGNRAAEVGELSRNLKMLAIYYDIPLLCLSQLNRGSETRSTKEPTMADLRESGSLEQDASIIFLMWNPDPADRSRKMLKTEKSRSGTCGTVELAFSGSMMRFDLADNIAPFGGD